MDSGLAMRLEFPTSFFQEGEGEPFTEVEEVPLSHITETAILDTLI